MSGQEPDEDERDLFRRAAGDIKEIKQDKVILETPKPSPHPRQTEADEAAVIAEIAQGFYDTDDIETGDELLFKRTGVQNKVLQKLRRGQFIIQAELDLHGLTANAAKLALAEFLIHCKTSQKRCVRIIHGKGLRSPQGKPVIKSRLPNWLQQRDEVLAYCSARPTDGGTGAVYVLLKRS